MKLLVTGASSFVGAHIARILSQHHEVFGSYFSTPLRYSRVRPIRIDLRKERDAKALSSLDVDAVVHVAAKIKSRPLSDESPAEAAQIMNRRFMDAVLKLNKPIVYASSTVVHWNRNIPYVFSRREDESRIMDSGLEYVILRPSAPYGPKLLKHCPAHKESFHTLANWVRNSPVVPMIGNGQYRRQPVHVEDFARAILALLESSLPCRAFEAGGGSCHSFREVIEIMSGQCNRNPFVLGLPKKAFVQVAKWLPDFDPSLLDAIDEDEVADPTALSDLTQVRFRPFQVGVSDLFR